MPQGFLLYYITDRNAFAGDERTRRRRLLDKIAEAAGQGVDYIQLREKDLSARELESLAREAARVIRDSSKLGTEERRTALLINSRTDVAITAGAAGVHLRGDDISAKEVKTVWRRAEAHEVSFSAGESSLRNPIISISCHSAREVAQAATDGATVALYAPVFEKKDATGTGAAGLDLLREACQAKIPVLALGGVTLKNVESCREAGAAGIAGIRLFQENDIAAVIRELRGPLSEQKNYLRG